MVSPCLPSRGSSNKSLSVVFDMQRGAGLRAGRLLAWKHISGRQQWHDSKWVGGRQSVIGGTKSWNHCALMWTWPAAQYGQIWRRLPWRGPALSLPPLPLLLLLWPVVCFWFFLPLHTRLQDRLNQLCAVQIRFTVIAIKKRKHIYTWLTHWRHISKTFSQTY